MTFDPDPIVVKLDVQPGDLVFVLVPADMPSAQMDSIIASFAAIMEDRKAAAVIAPDFLRFRVVRSARPL